MPLHEAGSAEARRLTRVRSVLRRLREKGLITRLREKLSLRRRLLRQSIKVRHARTLRGMGIKSPDFPPLNARTTHICKICGEPARVLGAVDFNKSCETAMGTRLPDLATPITYLTCTSCQFVFTEAFDNWTHDQYRDFIYNSEYKLVDPDYETLRPRAIAKKLSTILAEFRNLSILDYGGGNAKLAGLLRADGFTDVTVYDPFNPNHAVLPNRKFDLVTCFETFEHVPTPHETIGKIASFLKQDSALIFSTCLCGREFERKSLGWWYIAPRNGHISIFSAAALQIALRPLAWSSSRIDQSTHIAWCGTPRFFSPDLCRYFNVRLVNGQFASLADQRLQPNARPDFATVRPAPSHAA